MHSLTPSPTQNTRHRILSRSIFLVLGLVFACVLLPATLRGWLHVRRRLPTPPEQPKLQWRGGALGGALRWQPTDSGGSAGQKFQCIRNTFMKGTASLERRVYSQYGEDGVLEAIFRCIGSGSKYYVEFGTEDGSECTTRLLREQHGWSGVLMDGSHSNETINLHEHLIDAGNINSLLSLHSVPTNFDHLTIDIDLNTFWVLQALLEGGYRPRAIAAEFNRNFPPEASLTVPYDASGVWQGTCYMGASFTAMQRLLEAFGYAVVALDQDQINVYAIRMDEFGSHGAPLTTDDVLKGLVRSRWCWRLHHACQASPWLQVPEDVDFTLPRARWYDSLPEKSVQHTDVMHERVVQVTPAAGDSRGAGVPWRAEGETFEGRCSSFAVALADARAWASGRPVGW